MCRGFFLVLNLLPYRSKNLDWEKIIWALLIGLMIIMMLPRAKEMMRQSKDTESGDWSSVLLPIAMVVGFVALLIMLVR